MSVPEGKIEREREREKRKRKRKTQSKREKREKVYGTIERIKKAT